MAKIVSLLSQDKFYSAKPEIPNGFKVHFVEKCSDHEIIKACENADCLYSTALAGPINSFVLENIPSIQIIQTLGVGFDHVDIPATIRLGIPVANVPGANATSVAEHVIGMIIAVQRRILETDAEIKAGNYLLSRNKVLGEGLKEIRGSKIGIIGFGSIGQQVAKIALMMGASISYFAPRRKPPDVERQFLAEYKT
ncbi:MAG: NAD(P)-dependent oxidoreductase, partial [Sporomusa sp.]